MEQNETYQKSWDFIEKVKIGMLTTRDGKGGLSTRPMANVQKEFDGTYLYFLSDRDSKNVLCKILHNMFTLG